MLPSLRPIPAVPLHRLNGPPVSSRDQCNAPTVDNTRQARGGGEFDHRCNTVHNLRSGGPTDGSWEEHRERLCSYQNLAESTFQGFTPGRFGPILARLEVQPPATPCVDRGPGSCSTSFPPFSPRVHRLVPKTILPRISIHPTQSTMNPLIGHIGVTSRPFPKGRMGVWRRRLLLICCSIGMPGIAK